MNGAQTNTSAGNSSKGKDLDNHRENDGQGGFRPQQNMTVQAPRQEDLQESYAKIVGNDANPKGWYGSMSMSSACQGHSFNSSSVTEAAANGLFE